MKIEYIRKRDGTVQDFAIDKIERAISKAFVEVDPEIPMKESKRIATLTNAKIVEMCQQASTATPDDPMSQKCIDGYPAVEEIQDLVEQTLMEEGHYETAKAYIIYRNKRNEMRRRDLFKKRVHMRPYEYPELREYVDAIRHSYWIHTEFKYTSDVQDFHVNVTDAERNAIKNSMLAIAQIEVAVKTFWGDIYKKMPKPEIGAVGATFAESEVRHTDAYAHLLEILGLNDEFKKIEDIPALQARVRYLDRVLTLARTEENEQYAQSVLLFSLFIEHVSLFSQFLVMMSFNKHKDLFKGVSNAVEATSKEEQIHGLFGIDLINIMQDEHPEWFNEEWQEKIVAFCKDTYAAEEKIIDWIFEAGELDFLPAQEVKEFVKHRLNNSLVAVGIDRIFEVDEASLEKTEWFENEVVATKHVDFFNKRSINYNKRASSVTGDDLF